MNQQKISIREFKTLLKRIEDRITEKEESVWQLELEYGRETFIPTLSGVQFSENNETGEKCVIIQITRDI